MVSKAFLVSLLVGAIYGGIAGSYKISGASVIQSCIPVPEIVLKENGTIVKTTCSGAESTVTFGKWVQTSPNTIVEFLVDGTSEVKVQENPQENTLVYGSLSLKKVEPSALSLGVVANIFGDWKASQPQTKEECAIISGLSVMNTGQIIRYFCKGSSKDWMEKGFFRIDNYRDSQVNFSTIFNSSYVPITLVSDGPNNVIFKGVNMTRVA
ncbi:hypothetical protein DSO57_1035589 [Entomophthora muscae]|uniref:Uncharacterized protein n=1 Tax=Entomophthora muscae TaxID=34485 RepID=A0ACC2TLL4_9FUNG|nr:hypothetical protein DSO57_1035589 [Entomophthora muscae]